MKFNSNGELLVAGGTGGGGGGGGGDASAANQNTQIELETSIKNRLSSSDTDVIFTKLNQILLELESKTEPGNTQAINGNVTISQNNWEKLQSANDLAQTFTYLDAGTNDERISTIAYSSVSLNLSALETYSYAGSSGNYRILSILRT
ncbi:hypothetical protein [Trichormus variabilis]|uniref:Uncharacterized protein n=1 Tax=Trichormus variabilis SAG 1403-4b TaxID=447716 RepID=A0A3S1A2C7_ANAVA|nr:hypothetical protein [Trichormus variabilis]MBD2628481.1 hypothetical protein [Trichormus variabilis FACHB-164]RUS92515.1 hypothetical protein DSM107003_49980 [Trichormus variabilis SAG 1403-4b]